MVKTIDVTVGDQVVGNLNQPSRDYNFVYHNNVVPDNAVSVTMPIGELLFTHQVLHPIFAQNLPEGYLGDLVKRTVAKLYDSNVLTLLAVIGPHQIGRLGYHSEEIGVTGDATSPESIEHLLTSTDSELFQELLDKYALRSGLSGVQPKVLLSASVRERATLRTSEVIVKTWGNDYPHLATNEYFCMKVAQLSGLRTKPFELSDNGKLFVMERFDRRSDGAFLGFEDGCTLQGLPPEEKYSTSYEKLLKAIKTYSSPNHVKLDTQQFFLSLVVSWAVKNGDGHLKNYGILYDTPSGNRALSPTFDIVSTVAYLRNDVPALTMEGKKLWWNPKILARFGVERCELSPREVVDNFTRVGKALTLQIKAIEDYLIIRPEFGDIGKAMTEIFHENAVRLRDFIG